MAFGACLGGVPVSKPEPAETHVTPRDSGPNRLCACRSVAYPVISTQGCWCVIFGSALGEGGTMEARRRKVAYSPLPGDDGDNWKDEAKDLRFDYTPKSLDRIPWKSVALALFLVSLGSLLLLLSYFIFSGHMPAEPSQAYGLLSLGFLAFLPGFYETRIAYYSWRGAKGYRFSSIPSY